MGMTDGVHELEIARCVPLFEYDREGEDILASDDTDIDLPTLEKLRARCVQDVMGTHGQISFKDILKFQKEL